LSAPLLDVKNLVVTYKASADRSVKALDDVSLELPSLGYTIGIVGESGSGKTTLGLSLLNAIEKPGKINHGSVIYKERDVLTLGKGELRNYRWKEVSMIYQAAMNSLNPVKKISDSVAEVIREHTDMPRNLARERAAELLTSVGVDRERIDDYPHEFSGGMKQRAVTAMALALSPKILIADEPTSALDVVTQHHLLSLLQRTVAKEHMSLIFITHEISLLAGLVENIVVMYAGEIVERGPLDSTLSQPLHPYTEDLVKSASELELGLSSEGLPNPTLSGESRVDACKYVARCRYAFDRCRRERPILEQKEIGRWAACHKY
jgi:peptide/nickel transport system ATP-binding protein